MLVFGEMRPLIELLKKLLARNLQTISCPFQTKTLDYQIHASSSAERIGRGCHSIQHKLREILAKLSGKLLSFCKTRKEDTVLNRLHIGHSYLTHLFFILK